MQIRRLGITFTVVVSLMFTSCSDDDMMSLPGQDGRQICFDSGVTPVSRGMSVQSEPSDTFSMSSDSDDVPLLYCRSEKMPMESDISRASAVTSDNQVDEIGVVAYASWYEALLMNHDRYVRDGSGVYKSQDIRYWVDDEGASVDFYAFAPYSPDGLVLPDTKASTVLSYTVPPTVSEQADLLLAVSKGVRGNNNQAVGLTFRHMLAGVRVCFSELPEGWTVKSLGFDGVHRCGTLDFAAPTPSWSYTDEPDGSLSTTGVVAGETLFMTLPQTASESQPVTLTVVVNDGSADRVYTRQLTSAEWSMGNITTYTIGISNYMFSIDNTSDLDAHYVIHTANLKAEGVRQGKRWTVTCKPAGVSIQLQSDMNDFSRQGFWTDKMYEASSTTSNISARGENSLTLTGSGTFPIAIFVPENVSDEVRDITLSVSVDGGSGYETQIHLRQLHPAWSGDAGWEQIDDNTMAQYGFKWNRVVYYGYLYSTTLLGNQTYYNYLDGIIKENNAGQYASIGTYQSGIGRRRYYIKIDYGQLNGLVSHASDGNDGMMNTINLLKTAGTATTASFERVLESILKTESGHEDQTAFRLGNGQQNEAPAPTGDNIAGAPAVGDCIKKNRYNLRRTTTVVDGKANVSVTPFIKDEDIVWYLPGVDQFSSLPTEVVSPIVPADCWSSTAVTDGANAYLGNRSRADRLSGHKVRAVRSRN